MKMNWGWGIAIFYSCFVLAFVGIVIASTFFKPELVSDDYYRDEQAYQQIINKKINTNKLEEQPKYNLKDSKLEISFPLEHKSSKGQIIFFRPSDSSKDNKIAINLNSEAKQVIDVSTLASGKWLIKLDWESNGVKYYYEFGIVI